MQIPDSLLFYKMRLSPVMRRLGFQERKAVAGMPDFIQKSMFRHKIDGIANRGHRHPAPDRIVNHR